MNSKLLNFYCVTRSQTSQTPTALELILKKSYAELEACHDFIQWVFPTCTPSQFNPNAPILDDQTMIRLKKSTIFHLHFHNVLHKMLDFWGFEFTTEFARNTIVVRGLKSNRHWMRAGDHNMLRMTRCMESCRLLGWNNAAESMFKVLLKYSICFVEYNVPFITSTNLNYWYNAAYGDPWLQENSNHLIS